MEEQPHISFIPVSTAPYQIFNIGNSDSMKQMDYIVALCLSTQKNFVDIQPRDVPAIHTDVNAFEKYVGCRSQNKLKEGVQRFEECYQRNRNNDV